MPTKKILYIIIFFSLFSNAQNNNFWFVDDYYNMLSKSKDSAQVFCEQLILSNSIKRRAFGFAGKANIYTLSSKYEIADSLFKQSENILKYIPSEENAQLVGYILYLEALRYVETHEFENAQIILVNAIELCSEDCSLILEVKLQSALGRIYTMSKNNLKALKISQNCLAKIRKSINFSSSNELKKVYLKELVSATGKSINIYIEDKEKYHNYLDSTKNYISLSEKYSLENNIRDYNDYILAFKANVNFYQENYHIALRYFKEILNTFYKDENNKRTQQLLFKIGECHFYLKNNTEAEKIFLKQVNDDVWSEYQLVNFKSLCYYYLFKIYKEKDNSNLALHFAEQHVKENENYLKTKSISDLSVNDKMHIEERKKEANAFQEENKLQRQQKNRFFYLSLCLALIVLGLIIFFTFRQKRNKKNLSKLNERIIRLQKNVSKETQMSKTSSLKDDKALKLLKKLKALEDKELYLLPYYTLNMIAKRLDTNSSYLSETVNKHLGITFSEYSNRLKINSIIQRLEYQKSLRNYTIEALAKEAGYKSVNAFNTNFKKLLKVTPSQYLINLKDQ